MHDNGSQKQYDQVSVQELLAVIGESEVIKRRMTAEIQILSERVAQLESQMFNNDNDPLTVDNSR